MQAIPLSILVALPIELCSVEILLNQSLIGIHGGLFSLFRFKASFNLSRLILLLPYRIPIFPPGVMDEHEARRM